MPYNIYRDGALIASNVLLEEYTDTDLDHGKEYSYQVSSLNFYGESELSSVVKVKTLPLTLDINGTTKTGAFAEKTLDEDAYDDLAKKDSNTIYKVYPEGGNPDEAAWFLGEQPVDSAKEGDTVVYGRNLVANIKYGYGLKVSGEIIGSLMDRNNVLACAAKENTFVAISFRGFPELLRYGFLASSFSVGAIAKNVTEHTSVANKYEDIRVPTGMSMMVLYTYDMETNGMKVEKNTSCTTYTVAPEDVAIFTEATGGGAA